MSSRGMGLINQAVLKTLLYADVFSFPLKKEEIWTYLVYEKNVTRSDFDASFKKLPSTIEHQDEYFFLASSKNSLVPREVRQEASKQKQELAQKIVYYFSFLPTVLFVGISGAVAVGNADFNDDIDFFLICKKDTVWVTRLYCLLILQLLGRRRSRNARFVADMICLNMLIDESLLTFPKKKQTLYLAHEVTQLIPLFSRGSMYEKFLDSNLWINSFLSNALTQAKKRSIFLQKKYTDNLFLCFSMHPTVLQLSKFFQMLYMRKLRTSEQVEDRVLAFHPFDYASAIEKEYEKRLRLHDLIRNKEIHD